MEGRTVLQFVFSWWADMGAHGFRTRAEGLVVALCPGEADSVASEGLLGGEGRFGIVLPKANGANVVLAAGGKGFVPATGAGKFRHGF